MVFVVGKNNQLWVSLFEKGLAKIYGNYVALKAGRTVEGFATLTCAPCKHIDLEVDLGMGLSDAAQSLEVIWARLLSAKEANFLMGCSCGRGRRVVNDEEYRKIGLISLHAYSILDVKQYGETRLIRLRNSWGKFVWKGEWSLEWPGWNEKSKSDLYYEKVLRESGTFWMPFERFVQYFDSLELAHVRTGLGWSCKRFSPSVRTDDMFFEPEIYVICSLTLTNFVSEKSLPSTLVMHSGKPVETKLENCSVDVFRQSLVQMTLAEGTQTEFLENIFSYEISKDFSGLLLMVDNFHENRCVQVKANCNESQNVLSSRGELLVADCIPPLHRQILLILTHYETSQPCIFRHLLNQKITKAAKLGDFAVFLSDSQHEPTLMNPIQQALHGPKPLFF